MSDSGAAFSNDCPEAGSVRLLVSLCFGAIAFEAEG